jgi:hypothetical protein
VSNELPLLLDEDSSAADIHHIRAILEKVTYVEHTIRRDTPKQFQQKIEPIYAKALVAIAKRLNTHKGVE